MNDRESEILTAIGAKVAQARHARGVTQEALAEQLGIAPQTIRRIERGRTGMTVSRLLALADALGVPLLEFFDGVEHEPSEPVWDVHETAVVTAWRGVEEERRELLMKVMRAFG